MTTAIVFFYIYFIYSIVNSCGFIANPYVRVAAQLIVVGVVSAVYLKEIWNRDCKWAYVLAYGFRIGLLLFSVYGRSIAYLPFDGGDTEYFYAAVSEKTEHIEYGIDALVTVTAWLSGFLGDSRLLYQFISLMISMIGISVTDVIMQKIEIARNIRIKCLILAALFPSFSMFNVIYNRESLVVTGTMISFLAFLVYCTENTAIKRFVFLSVAFLTLFVVCLFHAAPFVVGFGYMIAILLYDREKKGIGVSKRSFIVFSVIALLTVALFVTNPGIFEKLRGITDVKSIAARFMYDKNLAAGSSYAQYVGDSDTWGRFIMYTPARMFYAMFAPLPWEWRGLADVATFFMNSLFYIVVSTVSIIDSLRKNYWNLFNKWLVMVLIFASAMIGWGCVAFGTSIRHRDKFFLLFIILFALELRGKDKQVCGGDMRTDEAEADI